MFRTTFRFKFSTRENHSPKKQQKTPCVCGPGCGVAGVCSEGPPGGVQVGGVQPVPGHDGQHQAQHHLQRLHVQTCPGDLPALGCLSCNSQAMYSSWLLTSCCQVSCNCGVVLVKLCNWAARDRNIEKSLVVHPASHSAAPPRIHHLNNPPDLCLKSRCCKSVEPVDSTKSVQQAITCSPQT